MLKSYINNIIYGEDSVLLQELNLIKKEIKKLKNSLSTINKTLDDNQKQNREEKKLKRWIEVTTKIGCSNNCIYCPQDMLLSSYCKGARNITMTLKDFKRALSHIPQWLDIDFAGFNEPFENSEAFDMVEYAILKGYKVSVFTTLKGLSSNKIEQLKKLNLKSIVIHLPDEEGMMKMQVDIEYLKKLRQLYDLNLPNVKYLCIGSVHKKIDKCIADLAKKDKKITYRADNLKNDSKLSDKLKYNENCGRVISGKQKIICSRRINYHGLDRTATHVECSVLLPDGSLVLCCQDYGLKHVLGNLYEQNYEIIMHGNVMREIEQSMFCLNNNEILCRKCEFACKYDEEKWKNFEKEGFYK